MYPYEIVPLEQSLTERIQKDFKGKSTRRGYVLIGPKKVLLESDFEQKAEAVYNFEVRPDDVWVVTYPRSGTTVTQEMTWLIVNDDYETAQKLQLGSRFPFFEMGHIESKGDNEEQPQKFPRHLPGWEVLKGWTERRFIKTHLPFSLLPPPLLTAGCKVIYVARHPKDVAVSCFHHKRAPQHGYENDFETFWDYFESNLLSWSPFWEHVKEGWEQRHNKNVYFLFYEDIVKDYKEVISKLAKFLEKDMTSEQIVKLADHLHIDNFKKNASVSGMKHEKSSEKLDENLAHVRKGKAGGWTDYFNKELNDRADRWIAENYKSTDLRFPEVLN